MNSAPAAATPRPPATGQVHFRRLLRTLLPAISLALILIGIAWLNPRAISYFGFSLMLNLAIPIVLVPPATARRMKASN
jgi:ribose transport system permease protein